MNTETKATHDAVVLGQRGTTEHRTLSYDSAKNQLLTDLKVVVTDAEKLIKEAADCSAEGFTTLRTRFDSKLVEARAKLDREKTVVSEKTKYASDATHTYVKENPWRTAGIAAVAGAVIGFLIARR